MRITKAIPIALVAAAAALPAHAADTGGASASMPASPQTVSCQEKCAELSAAQPGSVVRIYGENEKDVATVIFLGGSGTADDVAAKPSKVRSHTVYVTVPAKAVSGPLELVNVDGTPSPPSPALEIDHGATKTAKQGSVPPVEVKVETRKAFYDGTRPAGLDFLVTGSQQEEVNVALVSGTTNQVVAAWGPIAATPGTAQNVRWDGNDVTTGKAAPAGRYEFQIFTAPPGARAAQAGQAPTAAQSFLFLDHTFPLLGRHTFGTGANAFGAGRRGHIHQGQDVMAACGTPIVAARGGKVKFRGFQGNAGNYIVIDGAGTGEDTAYMHLREPALLKKGDPVRTGQLIGYVGETGDATVCHLHFELWTAPGWYTGGHPIDPLPFLRQWDQYS
jgi:murein DD-endopeptidase MepM/ murein hydrolase activator NlpD